MTVFMSVIGLFVFVFSLFTVGFKAGLQRLLMFAMTGFAIDLLVVAVASAVMAVH